ncbi:SSNA1-like protein [Mya arenaria]|uniref:SSNA1-like protein n=1 Tax=Mya arenaria TaxID=6604 RepID=A0ABY7FJQ1_MYAAR|nr:microtubule nucleation factor SSNA1-like [Mya arenaria]WAR22420.1 SSNA1-like protein [Mya arenaria]
MAENEPEVTPMKPDAALQKYSLELLTCVDEMKYRRDVLHKQVLREGQEKERLQVDLRRLTDQLVTLNEAICDHVIARNQINQAILETEAAFRNMATGSENLLHFLKKVTAQIGPLLKEPESTESEETDRGKRKSGRKSETHRR